MVLEADWRETQTAKAYNDAPSAITGMQTKARVSVVVQWVKPPPSVAGILYTWDSAALLLIRLPAATPGKAGEEGPRAWVPAIYVGGPDGVPGFRCWPGPVLVVVERKIYLSIALLFKQIHKKLYSSWFYFMKNLEKTHLQTREWVPGGLGQRMAVGSACSRDFLLEHGQLKVKLRWLLNNLVKFSKMLWILSEWILHSVGSTLIRLLQVGVSLAPQLVYKGHN